MEDKNNFGDFEEIHEESYNENGQDGQNIPVRVRMPRNKEMIGVIIQRLGGNKMDVKTTDGKTRNCRVPGKYKRKLWLRPKDFVLITPWEHDGNKGDVIYKYRPAEIIQLNKKGVTKTLTNEF